MKNFNRPGHRLSIAAAPYTVTPGQGLQMGAVFGVAIGGASSGAAVEISTEGVFTLTKQTGQAWTQGAALYWDNAGRQVTTTVSTNKLIGYAETAAGSADTTGRVWLPGL